MPPVISTSFHVPVMELPDGVVPFLPQEDALSNKDTVNSNKVVFILVAPWNEFLVFFEVTIHAISGIRHP